MHIVESVFDELHLQLLRSNRTSLRLTPHPRFLSHFMRSSNSRCNLQAVSMRLSASLVGVHTMNFG